MSGNCRERKLVTTVLRADMFTLRGFGGQGFQSLGAASLGERAGKVRAIFNGQQAIS